LVRLRFSREEKEHGGRNCITSSKTSAACCSVSTRDSGVLLLAVVGYAVKLLRRNVGTYAKAHHWTFPNIEYVLWAILIGLAISNTVGVPQSSARVWLRMNFG